MNYLLTGVKNNYINNIYAVLFCKMGSLESMPGVMMARDMLYFFVWNAVKLRQMFSKAKEYKALRMIAHDVIVPPTSHPSAAAPPYRGRMGGRRHHPGRMGRRPSGDTWGQHPFRIDIACLPVTHPYSSDRWQLANVHNTCLPTWKEQLIYIYNIYILYIIYILKFYLHFSLHLLFAKKQLSSVRTVRRMGGRGTAWLVNPEKYRRNSLIPNTKIIFLKSLQKNSPLSPPVFWPRRTFALPLLRRGQDNAKH